MQRFSDVVIVPYQDLGQQGPGRSFHKGGPIWPDWDRQRDARHCRNGEPVDAEPNPVAPEVILDAENLVWCGPLVGHFGHAVADFGMRIFPSLQAIPDATLVFSSGRVAKTCEWNARVAFFKDVIEHFGGNLSRTIIVDRPTLVRSLWVAPQAEQLSHGGATKQHLQQLREHVATRLGTPARSGTLFVSRAGVEHHLAGETYLETALERAGLRVVRPERHAIPEQLKAYLAADHLLFTEGSAIHGVQLLGDRLGDVTVLARRPGVQMAKGMLEPRSGSVSYLQPKVDLVCGLTPSGSPAAAFGIPIMDGDELVEQLLGDGIDVRPHWSSSAFREAVELDVEQRVESWFSRRRVGGQAGIEYYLQTLRSAGFEQLAARYGKPALRGGSA